MWVTGSNLAILAQVLLYLSLDKIYKCILEAIFTDFEML